MDKANSNTWIHKTYNDFIKGNFNDTMITEDENPYITLKKRHESYAEQGIYTSDTIYTNPFKYLVLSWNVYTPFGTEIKIEAQVLVNQGHLRLWSKWISIAVWSTSQNRHSFLKETSKDSIAYVDADTLIIKGLNGETASAVRYRLTLKTSTYEATPKVRLIAGTIRNTLESYNKIHNNVELNKELNVPRFSQMVRNPKIASIICSPTSMTMILNYHGLNLIPEDTAWGVYDTIYDGFGNWPFNTAFAGSLGFESYVCYCTSIDDLKKEINNNFPVAVSVKYRNSESIDANLPIIHGAPINKTNGHLIVICGFVNESGKSYIIVNDPAADSDENVRLKYLVDEFDSAWQGSGRIAYIVHPLL